MKIPTYSVRLLLLLWICFSCGNNPGNVSIGSAKRVHPRDEVSLGRDSSFLLAVDEIANYIDIQLVNDTILVLQNQVPDESADIFTAYSTQNFGRLGTFARKGRGPTELLSPRIVKVPASVPYLCISDSFLGESYYIDVAESAKQKQLSCSQSLKLPQDCLDFVPISSSSWLFIEIIDNELILHLSDEDKTKDKVYRIFKGLAAGQYLTHLSSVIASNAPGEMIALCLVSFPQIIFIDSGSDLIRSVATDNDYKRWRETLQSSISIESIQYYDGVAASDDYLFALYRGFSINEVLSGGKGSQIHIFDWHGNFLYNIKVKENLRGMCFDSVHKMLYCLDGDDGIVIRYSLAQILPPNK